MTNDQKLEKQNPHPIGGTDGSVPSTDPGGDQPDGNGQQGAGGLGGITERTTPNPQGSQPQLGGANGASSERKPGSGLTEDSDPTSDKTVPEVSRSGLSELSNDAPRSGAKKPNQS